MLPIETAATFFLTSIILALAPGPDNIFVLTQSALKGGAAGFIVTLGLCTGLVFHTSAVAFGVAVIFQTSLVAFNTLKFLGVCYLLYLAWKAFQVSVNPLQSRKYLDFATARLYRRGIIMNISNPKVSIFFLAFLPQFTYPSLGHLTLQIILLGGIFIIATLLVFGVIALLAGKIGGWLKHSPKTQLIMNRIAGGIFIGLALRLLAAQR
jgi:threonine/homoserine/homoserine lactone efflux protein